MESNGGTTRQISVTEDINPRLMSLFRNIWGVYHSAAILPLPLMMIEA